MARFLKHTSCPSCGSRDNLALYDDGSEWCFGCHYYLPPKHVPISGVTKEDNEDKPCLPLPDDTSTEFSDVAIQWVQQYGITVEELFKHDVKFSAKYNQLIFTWYDDSNNLLAWQARNFGTGRRKYFTSGNINVLCPIFRFSDHLGASDSTLTLVEDCLSAIKIARQSDCMPALGSGIGLPKLSRVAGLYSRLNVWLDSNMFQNSLEICSQGTLVGLSCRPIYTDLDPKCYSDTEIEQILQKST